MIQVVEYPNPQVEDRVDRFLGHSRQARGICAEHDPRWLAVLHRALGHRVFMIVAFDNDGHVCGYLPVALLAGRFFGRFLVSLPYLNRGGVVANDLATSLGLIDQAVELAGQLDVTYLELRHNEPIEHEALPKQRDEKFLMLLDLPRDDATLWQQFSAKVRNQIRKGDRNDLTIRWGGRGLVDAFYSVFAVNMRDLGTPVYSRKLFDQITQRFEKEAELAVVEYQGLTVAAALLVHHSGTTQVPSASSLRRFNYTNANMWMYHQLLCRSIVRGSRQFDFGRSSKDSGTYRFKKQWGAEPRRTVWQYHLRRGDLNMMRPENPRFKRRIAMWQKMPVWATRLIGPAIIKSIP